MFRKMIINNTHVTRCSQTFGAPGLGLPNPGVATTIRITLITDKYLYDIILMNNIKVRQLSKVLQDDHLKIYIRIQYHPFVR